MSAHAADGELARPAGKVAATGTVPGDGLDPGTGPRSGDGSDPGAGPDPGTGPGPGAGSGPGDGPGAGFGAQAASACCLETDGGSGAQAPRSGRVPGGARGQGDVADGASTWAGDVVASLEGVSITYVTRGSARTVVSSYDLVLRAGAVTCLAGRTGCGKTSLLRVVAGLLQPSTGSVTWAGEPVPWRRPERVAAARAGFLGYAGQDSPVLPGLSVLGNILLGCPPGRASRAVRAGLRQRAVDLADELDLHEVLDQDAATLSGGERQRTAVARALPDRTHLTGRHLPRPAPPRPPVRPGDAVPGLTGPMGTRFGLGEDSGVVDGPSGAGEDAEWPRGAGSAVPGLLEHWPGGPGTARTHQGWGRRAMPRPPRPVPLARTEGPHAAVPVTYVPRPVVWASRSIG